MSARDAAVSAIIGRFCRSALVFGNWMLAYVERTKPGHDPEGRRAVLAAMRELKELMEDNDL